MAETAAILCPDKTVLLPDLPCRMLARCLHYRGGTPEVEGKIARRCRGRLHQHVGCRKSRERLLLHIGQCCKSRPRHSYGPAHSLSTR